MELNAKQQFLYDELIYEINYSINHEKYIIELLDNLIDTFMEEKEMKKTVEMNDLQQKLVKEFLEQDMEYIQNEGIPSADNEIDRKGLIKCLEAEQELFEKLEE